MMKLSSSIKQQVIRKIPRNYQCALFDNSVKTPFLINDELMKRMDILQEQYSGDEAVSRGIFTYLCDSITYGFTHKSKGYGTSTEVWESKEGICGEMSFLYTTLARYCSIKSECVDVLKDRTGKKVRHMCSQVYVPHPVLVDISYKTYDINHITVKPMQDVDVLRCFSTWRK